MAHILGLLLAANCEPTVATAIDRDEYDLETPDSNAALCIFPPCATPDFHTAKLTSSHGNHSTSGGHHHIVPANRGFVYLKQEFYCHVQRTDNPLAV
jgi:hypothetical protein